MLEPAVLLVIADGFRSMNGALVTGAGKRIGRALALALAADGFFVFVHHKESAAEARQTVVDIAAAGGRAKAVRADLASARQAEALVGRCKAPGVALTCLVNSASLFKLDRAPTATAADFDLHMAINLRAPLLLSQALARQLPAGETGVIVNVLDQKLFNLNPDFLTYTLAKVGLQGLTTLLAQSFAPAVRVAGIAPGLSLRSGSQTDARFAEQHADNPLGVGVGTDDLVRALRFILATPTYTGTTLLVDGGEHLIGRPRDIAFDRRFRPGRVKRERKGRNDRR
jgi:NAD(P)-dependent dehydrogenase (short-subunit alcohol dehydrogenase family)